MHIGPKPLVTTILAHSVYSRTVIGNYVHWLQTTSPDHDHQSFLFAEE